jgi:heat shock protein HslJ
MVIKTLVYFSLVFIAALASCTGSNSTGTIKSTYWELNSLMELSSNTIIVKPTVEFTSDGKLSGFGGCNKFSGKYKVSGNKLTTSEVVSTEMACENSQVEAIFLQALQKTSTYEIEDSKLYLYSNGNLKAILTKTKK